MNKREATNLGIMDPWLQSDRAARQLHWAQTQLGKPKPFPPVRLKKPRTTENVKRRKLRPAGKKTKEQINKAQQDNVTNELNNNVPTHNDGITHQEDDTAETNTPNNIAENNELETDIARVASVTEQPRPPSRAFSDFALDYGEYGELAQKTVATIQTSALELFERELSVRSPMDT